MFDESVYVGMMQPVSLNSWSYKTTENLWASNIAGQQCFETWQVRSWSKCHTGRKRQRRVEPLSIKACCWCSDLHRRKYASWKWTYKQWYHKQISMLLCCPVRSDHFCLHCSPYCCNSHHPGLGEGVDRSRWCRQTKNQNKSVMLQQGLDPSPVNNNNCVWWGWKHHCWGLNPGLCSVL